MVTCWRPLVYIRNPNLGVSAPKPIFFPKHYDAPHWWDLKKEHTNGKPSCSLSKSWWCLRKRGIAPIPKQEIICQQAEGASVYSEDPAQALEWGEATQPWQMTGNTNLGVIPSSKPQHHVPATQYNPRVGSFLLVGANSKGGPSQK